MPPRRYYRVGKGSPKGGQFASRPQAGSASLSQRVDAALRAATGRRPAADNVEAADRIPDLVSGVDPGTPHGEAMAHTLAVIDRLHAMPDGLLLIRLDAEIRPGHQGSYRGSRITLNPAGRYPRLTAAHELMHFLDHRLGPGGNQFASDAETAPGGRFHEWHQAAQNSRTARYLQALKLLPDGSILVNRQRPDGTVNAVDVDHAHIDYLLSPREMLGRSYAQWVAIRSGDPKLLADLDLAQDPANGETPLPGSGPHVGYPGYWELDDFHPIADELDALFERLGLLR